MEIDVKKLINENAELEYELDFLRSENDFLKKNVSYLERHISFLFSRVSELKMELCPDDIPF